MCDGLTDAVFGLTTDRVTGWCQSDWVKTVTGSDVWHAPSVAVVVLSPIGCRRLTGIVI